MVYFCWVSSRFFMIWYPWNSLIPGLWNQIDLSWYCCFDIFYEVVGEALSRVAWYMVGNSVSVNFFLLKDIVFFCLMESMLRLFRSRIGVYFVPLYFYFLSSEGVTSFHSGCLLWILCFEWNDHVYQASFCLLKGYPSRVEFCLLGW